MKIETYSYKGETVYSIVPFFKKPKSILVSNDAPPEAHEYAKQQLIKAFESEKLSKKIGRTLIKIGHTLSK